MKFAILIFSLLFANVALANNNLGILCPTGADCESKILTALVDMGCDPVQLTLKCGVEVNPEDDPAHTLCTVETMKCSEPRASLFISTYCMDGESEIRFKKYDRDLTLSWWMGTFGSYISYICIK